MALLPMPFTLRSDGEQIRICILEVVVMFSNHKTLVDKQEKPTEYTGRLFWNLVTRMSLDKSESV